MVSELPWATADSVAEVAAFHVVSSLRCVLSNRGRAGLVLRVVPLFMLDPQTALASDANFDGALDEASDDNA